MRVLLLLPVVACTSESTKPFVASRPPADVCGLLALSDVQTILPTAELGGPLDGPPDTADYWSRDCQWNVSGLGTGSVELVIFGATTQSGETMIRLAAASGNVNRPVSGLGDEAHYWEQDTSDNGLWAIEGSVSVDVTAYYISPFPTADQMKPLVAKALGEL